MADWQSQIVDVDVAVEPVTPQSNVFSLAAHVATVTFGSSGDIFRVATGVSDLDTWLAAGEIDAAAHAAGATAFAQTPSPARWMLIKYATAYADSLTAVWNTGARFLYYTIEARTAADATSAAGFASAFGSGLASFCRTRTACRCSPLAISTRARNSARSVDCTARRWRE
jgi:hypothetical protein